MLKQKLILVGLVLMASSAASIHGFNYQAWTEFAALGKGVGAQLLQAGDRAGWKEQVARETACLGAFVDALRADSAAQRAAYSEMNSDKLLFALGTFLVMFPIVAVFLAGYFERRGQKAQEDEEEAEKKKLA